MVYRRRLAAAAAVLALAASAAPASAGPAAAQGLVYLSEINLFVAGNLTTSNEVEGNAWIGGSLSGQTENFGTGASLSGQTYVGSSIPTLTVGGNITSSNGVQVNETSLPMGATYGVNIGGSDTAGLILNGATGGPVTVGGSLSNFHANGGTLNVGGAGSNISENSSANAYFDLSLSSYSAQGGKLYVGGNATVITENNKSTVGVNGNVSNITMNNGGTLAYGGTLSGSQNLNGGVVKIQGGSPAIAANLSAATSIASETATILGDLESLSKVLASLPATPGDGFTITSNNGNLNATVGTGFIVIDVTASQLEAVGNQFNYNIGSVPVIVNVTDNLAPGATITINANDNNAKYASDVLWNFEGATNLQFNKAFDGGVLAPVAHLIGSNTQLDGSVAVGSFVENGEVHLGTFDGDDALERVVAVPEPATWGLLLVGAGLLGGDLRRRRRGASVSAQGSAGA
jgi:choice-of-anchor A domain-containing protein